jgi:NAD(P)-dependent dehydrogenase (short-subunit alcohol dehydrogenase family)
MSQAKRLAGKRPLVTGGSRGIGAAIVRRLAVDGATVAVNYVADQWSADALVARALNPSDESSSSRLTSTNVWLLTSPPPEKRKVSPASADVDAVHHLRTHAGSRTLRR